MFTSKRTKSLFAGVTVSLVSALTVGACGSPAAHDFGSNVAPDAAATGASSGGVTGTGTAGTTATTGATTATGTTGRSTGGTSGSTGQRGSSGDGGLIDASAVTTTGGTGDGGASTGSLGNDGGAGSDAGGTTGASSGSTTSTSGVTSSGGDAGATNSGTTGRDGGPVGDASTACTDRAPCLNGPDPGLCVAGVCGGCVDVTGDPACVAAYGSGYLCIAGACVKAQCHVAADCADAGPATCVNHACVSTACRSDGDCTDATKPVCDLTTGSCVSGSAACAGKAAGDVCAGAASKHLCCGAALACKAIACCTDAQCPSGQTCTAQQTCANPSCPAVTDHAYYVDINDPGTNGRTGSSGCPFKSLNQAFAFITGSSESATYDVTVYLRSNLDPSIDTDDAFPVRVPSGILVKGVLSGANVAPVVKVPEGTTGFVFNYPKASGTTSFGGLSQLTISQPTDATGPSGSTTKTGFGVWITGTYVNALTANTNINVANIVVRGFLHGIHLDTGGYVGIGQGVTLTANYHGLFSDGGYARVRVGAAETPTHFDSNVHSGIYVGGGSVIDVVGADLPPSKTITANSNTFGVRFRSNGTVPTGLVEQLLQVEMSRNTGVDTAGATIGAGLYVYAGGPLKVRNSLFVKNYRGIFISSDNYFASDGGTTSPNDVSGIDLAGGNVLSGDPSNTLLCSGIISPAGAGQLHAENNTWNTRDCSTATAYADGGSNILLKTAPDCTSKLDVGGMTLANTLKVVVVDKCALTP